MKNKMGPLMEIKSFEDVNDFLKETESLLNQNESFYNLKLGVSIGIRDKVFQATDSHYIALYENQVLVGCALRTNLERPLAISKMSKPSIDCLIKYLIENKVTLAGVVGEFETSSYFKDIWHRENDLNFNLQMHLGVYEARNVIVPNNNGEIVLGTHEYKKIIFDFVKAFSIACFPNQEHKDEDIDRICSRHINGQSLFLLKNTQGEIVSMAANVRSTMNGGTVSLVYMPPEFRGKSYGSIVTALVTQKILKEKKFASLFTDLKNPTSNSIYQKIGYKMIGENIHYDFLEKP